nr:RNA polymerase sigma factor [uncultured Acetobacterium sp.]
MAEYDFNYIALLVKKAQFNDSDAFAELYSLTYKSQYIYACNYLKDKDLAQDALQEIYILVLKNIHTLKEPQVFISWLKQISFRVCYDMNHSKQTIEAKEGASNEELAYVCDEHIDNNPEAKIMMTSKQMKIQNAIKKLPTMERDALLLKFVSNMKQEEIARYMGCSLSSVKRYLSKGRKHLYNIQLEEETNELQY